MNIKHVICLLMLLCYITLVYANIRINTLRAYRPPLVERRHGKHLPKGLSTEGVS